MDANCALIPLVLSKIAKRKYGLNCKTFDVQTFQKIFINNMDCTEKYVIKKICLPLKECENNIIYPIDCTDEPTVVKIKYTFCDIISETCEENLLEEKICLHVERKDYCNLVGWSFASLTEYHIQKILPLN